MLQRICKAHGCLKRYINFTLTAHLQHGNQGYNALSSKMMLILSSLKFCIEKHSKANGYEFKENIYFKVNL